VSFDFSASCLASEALSAKAGVLLDNVNQKAIIMAADNNANLPTIVLFILLLL
jgi:hypothetical protein